MAKSAQPVRGGHLAGKQCEKAGDDLQAISLRYGPFKPCMNDQ
jgi:hypothetical protein